MLERVLQRYQRGRALPQQCLSNAFECPVMTFLQRKEQMTQMYVRNAWMCVYFEMCQLKTRIRRSVHSKSRDEALKKMSKVSTFFSNSRFRKTFKAARYQQGAPTARVCGCCELKAYKVWDISRRTEGGYTRLQHRS